MRTHQRQILKVFRYDPGNAHKPRLESYGVDLQNCGPMILDALIHIKSDQDSTLSFRRSCREGICGSCAMNIDGKNMLACLTYIRPIGGPIEIRPLSNCDVIKDLVPDLSNFFNSHKAVEPWLQRKTPRGSNEREILQSPQDRRKLDGLYECILCACCSTACPPYWWNMEAYLGPAALLQAYRWISDSRDEMKSERLAWLNDSMRLFRCHNIQNCTDACPKHLDPAGAISNIKWLVKETGLEHYTEVKKVVDHTDNTRSGLSIS
jgi:succinate dehydrogenase (ubiquinone) iron-sulfur subunit